MECLVYVLGGVAVEKNCLLRNFVQQSQFRWRSRSGNVWSWSGMVPLSSDDNSEWKYDFLSAGFHNGKGDFTKLQQVVLAYRLESCLAYKCSYGLLVEGDIYSSVIFARVAWKLGMISFADLKTHEFLVEKILDGNPRLKHPEFVVFLSCHPNASYERLAAKAVHESGRSVSLAFLKELYFEFFKWKEENFYPLRPGNVLAYDVDTWEWEDVVSNLISHIDEGLLANRRSEVWRWPLHLRRGRGVWSEDRDPTPSPGPIRSPSPIREFAFSPPESPAEVGG